MPYSNMRIYLAALAMGVSSLIARFMAARSRKIPHHDAAS